MSDTHADRAADLVKWVVPAILGWFALILAAIALGIPVFQSDSGVLKWVYVAVMVWMLFCLVLTMLTFAAVHAQTDTPEVVHHVVDNAIENLKRFRSSRTDPEPQIAEHQ
ncbi:hypothetical protein GCM10009853_032100 [Glycomyces scopariae]